MKIGIKGSSGLIGTALIPLLEHLNHQIVRLKRDEYDLEGLDAVINLSGEPVFGLWTPSKKNKIKSSRLETAKNLFSAIRAMKNPPRIVINASAVGFYGDRGEAIIDETSGPGSGFLAEVVQSWEMACNALSPTRVVFARFGIVLSKNGGALSKMLPAFKLGLGGNLGSGKQFMSWIALEDAIGAIYHILNDETISGPVNIVSPNPVRNEEFTKTLGNVLNRPTLFSVPAFMIKTLFGQMGEELLLYSAKIQPLRLLEKGYPFLYPTLKAALQHEIKGSYGV